MTFNCNTEFIGKQHIWLEETDSTNSLLRRLLSDGVTIEHKTYGGMLIEGAPKEGAMIVADSQNAGRGRSGHTWKSPAGTSIALSVLLKPDVNDNSIPIVTLIAALAVSETVKKVCNLDTKIKWPNDIIVGGRKICGILTELDITDGRKSLILGVGINVNQQSFPDDISDIATSLLIETGVEVDRALVVSTFAEALEKYYKKFLITGNMSLLKNEYEKLLINIGKEVKVLDPLENITGIARGIDDNGELLVETKEGVVRHVYAGEVSVRGIYGYV